MAAVRKKDIWICSAWQDRKKVTVHTCVSSDEKRDTAEAVSLFIITLLRSIYRIRKIYIKHIWKTGTLES